jgi:hypothetical protein
VSSAAVGFGKACGRSPMSSRIPVEVVVDHSRADFTVRVRLAVDGTSGSQAACRRDAKGLVRQGLQGLGRNCQRDDAHRTLRSRLTLANQLSTNNLCVDAYRAKRRSSCDSVVRCPLSAVRCPLSALTGNILASIWRWKAWVLRSSGRATHECCARDGRPHYCI